MGKKSPRSKKSRNVKKKKKVKAKGNRKQSKPKKKRIVVKRKTKTKKLLVKRPARTRNQDRAKDDESVVTRATARPAKKPKENKQGTQEGYFIERINSGVKGFDKLIQGGFVKDSVVMIRGDTGVGKTNFCLQYLYNGAVQYEEPGVFLSFAETSDRIYQHGKNFGWEYKELEDKNLFRYMRYEPHEVARIMDEGGGSIKDLIDSIGAKRLVIDSLTAYSLLFENVYKANESILNLFEMFKKWKCTTLVTSEIRVTPNMETAGRLGFLTDGIINLYYLRVGTRRVRALEIMKMRDTSHTDKLTKFHITTKGIVIDDQHDK